MATPGGGAIVPYGGQYVYTDQSVPGQQPRGMRPRLTPAQDKLNPGQSAPRGMNTGTGYRYATPNGTSAGIKPPAAGNGVSRLKTWGGQALNHVMRIPNALGALDGSRNPLERSLSAVGVVNPLAGWALEGAASAPQYGGFSALTGGPILEKVQQSQPSSNKPTAQLSQTPPVALEQQQKQQQTQTSSTRPRASGTVISIGGKAYDTGYHAAEIAELRRLNPGGGNAGQSQSVDPAKSSYVAPTGEPLSIDPATPEGGESVRINSAGIQQEGKKLSSQEMGSLGLQDASRFWQDSGASAGDAPPKKSNGGIYNNKARNAARAAFLDPNVGSMAGYRNMQRAVGGDMQAGFNVGGENYQWQDGVDTATKRKALHALTGGAGNTREGFNDFAQQFLKGYTDNGGVKAGETGVSLADIPEEEFVARQTAGKKTTKETQFHPEMSREQFVNFQQEVPEATQQISF